MGKDLLTYIWLGTGVAAFAAGLIALGGRRRRLFRQNGLDRGFERARHARRSGSGIQGRPYSIYCEPDRRD